MEEIFGWIKTVANFRRTPYGGRVLTQLAGLPGGRRLQSDAHRERGGRMTSELQNCPPSAAAGKGRYQPRLAVSGLQPLAPLAAALGREFSALEPDNRPKS